VTLRRRIKTPFAWMVVEYAMQTYVLMEGIYEVSHWVTAGAFICIKGFIKIGLSFQNLIGELYGHTDFESFLYFRHQINNDIYQWILQIMFPSACSFIVLVFTVSLHPSAYMAIFMCVGYIFFFVCLKDSVSLHFFLPFSRGYTPHVSICV
jgi:hypothetical protein